jgi:hypothetical protein
MAKTTVLTILRRVSSCDRGAHGSSSLLTICIAVKRAFLVGWQCAPLKGDGRRTSSPSEHIDAL